MNIAFAIERFSTDHGGAERYARGLAMWLAGHGHAVDVFTRHAPAGVASIREVVRLDARARFPRSRQSAFAHALTEALTGRPYDVVHGFDRVWPCDILQLNNGIHASHNPFSPRRINERHQFDDPGRRFVATSQRVADDISRHYPTARGRVQVIYPGVDTSEYNPAQAMARRPAARARWALKQDDIALLFVSGDFCRDGLADLIAALPAVNARLEEPTRLLVAGGDRVEPFFHIARKAGLERLVTFCGNMADLRDAYAAADALVHPSHGVAFGTACLEGLACGLPVVTTRACGISELLAAGHGAVLVDAPCSIPMLAAAVLRAADPSFREDARIYHAAIAQHFTAEGNYRQVLAMYEMIAASRT